MNPKRAIEGLQSDVFSVRGSFEQLQQTLASIWRDTLAHLPAMVAGVATLAFTWAVATVAKSLLERYLDRRGLRRSMRDLLLRFALIGIWVVGLMVTAMLLFPGLTPTKALGVLGVGSVAVGLAFKDIFENFLAGVMVLWRFPFDIGDTIECDGLVGRVERITIRNTILKLPTDELVVLPNSTLFKNPVQVVTEHPRRRIETAVGVAYDVDPTAALDVVRSAVQRCETVSDDPEPQVLLTGFGASSVDIEVAWWADSSLLGERRSRSEVVAAIKHALDEAEMEIPFPYRTLTFKDSLDVGGSVVAGVAASDSRSRSSAD